MLSPEISDLESFIDSYHSGAQNENNQMHHNTQSPSMTMRHGSGSSEFGGFTSVSQIASGTELWGEKPRGIDWGTQGSNDMRENFEHKRPAIQERRAHNWNAEAQYSMAEHSKMQQHSNNNNVVRSMQDHQKENKEMASFISSLLQSQQQMRSPQEMQFNPGPQFNHQMLRGIRPPLHNLMGAGQSMMSTPPPPIHLNSRMPGAAASSGNDFYHQKQREMAAPRAEYPPFPLNSMSTQQMKQSSPSSDAINWAKMKEQQLSVAAAHHQAMHPQDKWSPVDYQQLQAAVTTANNMNSDHLNKMIDLEGFLQLSQKLKQASSMTQESLISPQPPAENMKQGSTGLMMNRNTYNPLMQPQQQQQQSLPQPKETSSPNSVQVNDLDVNELRKQIISGELVVVRKGDLIAATMSGKDNGSKENNHQQQQQQIGGRNANNNNEQGKNIEGAKSANDRRLSSEDNVFYAPAYKPPSRQQSSDSSAEQRRPTTTFYKSSGRKSRSDEDPDWRSRDNKTPVARKPSFETQYRRKKSAADEDPDWRRRDSNELQVGTRSSSAEESRKQPNATNGNVIQTKSEVEVVQYAAKQPTSTAAAAKKTKSQGETTSADSPRQKHSSSQQTRNPKLEIQNWITDDKKGKNLQRQQPLDEIMKSLTIVEGNIDDAQLSVFMEKIQLSAGTEEKLRSYADDLCNRAIEHPSFGYGASLLCHRMSWMMVEHGTKFRSMVFSHMEKQYMSRETLFRESFVVGNIRWFGLVHFLVHLYLNVRVPDTDKRFAVLVKPVFNCLLQVLRSNRVTANQVKCFGEMFRLTGMCLEEDDSAMMATLMSEVRDSSLTSHDPGIRDVYLRCVRMYATRWEVLE